ncbi:MAG: hypothetical protein AAGA30_10415 [Planctomycetota bacterium]
MKFLKLIAVVAGVYFCLFAAQEKLGSASENAVIVVNNESASSKLVANFYIENRRIPPENVVYLSDIPRNEIWSIADFKELALKPIFEAIQNRGINHIDYLIYSSDFPTIIDASSMTSSINRAGQKWKINGTVRKSSPVYVSINAATFFASHIVANDAGFINRSANTYAAAPADRLFTTPFTGKTQNDFQTAIQLARINQWQLAISRFEQLSENHPHQIAIAYWLAKAHSKVDDINGTLKWLKKTISLGFDSRQYIDADRAFESVRGQPEFELLTQSLTDKPLYGGPSISFESDQYWGLNGSVNGNTEQGKRFLLSTILAVNRSQGNSEFETLRYLEKSIESDGTQPTGTFYFTKTQDIRSKSRYPGIEIAIKELNALGFNTSVTHSIIPENRTDIIGLSIGTPQFNWPNSNNRIIPGAICENFTSYGGRLLPKSDQTKLSTFLRSGAAGSSGTIVEPFAINEKFPQPRLHVHYARGCTLAEAFYRSVVAPFQLLIVGDALCCPWAQRPNLNVKTSGLENARASGEIILQAVRSKKSPEIDQIEIYLDGRLNRTVDGEDTGEITLDTTTMPDGYHEFRFVGVAPGPIRSRGFATVPLLVENENQVPSISCQSRFVTIDQWVKLKVEAENADQIDIVHNSKVLESIESSTGQFKIPSFRFGRGRVKIEAHAKFGQKRTRSWPIDITIQGPIKRSIPELIPVKPTNFHATINGR